MAISDTITSMYDNTSNAYTMLSYGTDLTGINKNLNNLSNTIFEAFLESLRDSETLYTNLPKTSGSGSQITLNGTAYSPMRITLGSSALEQTTYIGKNLLNVPSSYTFKRLIDKPLSLEAGTYIFSYASRVTEGTEHSFLRFTYNDSTYLDMVVNSSTTSYTITLTKPVVSYNLYSQNSYNSSTMNVTFTNLMISTTGGEYEPYVGGTASPNPSYPQDIHTISGNNSIVVSDGNGVSQTNTIDLTPYNLGSIGNYENKFIRSGGENLLLNTLLTTATTKNGITATPNNDGSVSLSGTSTATTYFNLTNTDFGTTSFNSVYGGSTEYVANTGNTNTNIRIAYDSGNKYTYIQVNNATTTNVTIFPMINKGTTALPYVPYEKGWYYKEGIGKVVLDGSESWNEDITQKIAGIRLNNIYYNYDTTFTAIGMSNRFIGGTLTECRNNANIFSTYDNSINNLWLNKQNLSLNDFKTWLSNNNTIVYYPLATPTYTKLTDTALINQLENIYKNMLSYKGTTNISQVNNDLPFTLSVSAIEDLS